jgi:hypothetical protein
VKRLVISLLALLAIGNNVSLAATQFTSPPKEAPQAVKSLQLDPLTVLWPYFLPEKVDYTWPAWPEYGKPNAIRWRFSELRMDDIAFYREGHRGGWQITLHGPRAGIEWIELIPSQRFMGALQAALVKRNVKVTPKRCSRDGILLAIQAPGMKPAQLAVQPTRVTFFPSAELTDEATLNRAGLPKMNASASCRFRLPAN